ncbi:hypothetical protein MLD38_009875 [Melastoma candidum]|uniref:Uncharacterized protein n=1 Tax=Melastoma candidum TaxID=119954 RepID=A0ACB9S3A5_9MYRT|nr:hypothetical protein MLD38_009875 [Melastoma candidum]
MASLSTTQNPSFLQPTKPSRSSSLSPPTIVPFFSAPSLSPSFQRFSLSASKTKSPVAASSDGGGKTNQKGNVPVQEQEDEVIEVEEELPWIQEKALDLVEFTGSVTQAIPGPRVGSSSLPWILAVPLAYVGVSFVIAVVKTVRKFGSPREQRRRLVNKNAMLCKSIDELFQKGAEAVQPAALIELSKKTGFGMERYCANIFAMP